jgi:hypothetical protein
MIVELVALGLWLGGCLVTGLWIRSLKGVRERNEKKSWDKWNQAMAGKTVGHGLTGDP